MKNAPTQVNTPNIYAQLSDLRRLQFVAKGFSLLANQPANSILSGKNVSKLRGRGLNFEELRHYRPGDDIRSMDWKVTRRTGKPHIKVYTEEKERNVYLVIDQRRTMFFGSTHKMKSVIAAELSALFAWQVTHAGDRIGAVIYNDTQTKIIPAKRGTPHVLNLLNEVIKMNHDLTADVHSNEKQDNFNPVLAKLNQIIKKDALVIFIGDGHGWNEESTAFLKKIRQHNEIIACHIFDPLELELPKMAQMVVSDGQWQIQFSSQNPDTQKKYQQVIEKQVQNYEVITKKYRIPLLTIDTLSPVDKQVRKALGGKR